MKLKPSLVFMLAALASCHSNGQQKSTVKTKSVNSKPALSAYSEIIQTIPDKTYPGLAPGTIAPDAVQVDAEGIDGIVDGVCFITKGNQHALVDLKGNFIKNWSDFSYINSAPFSTLIGMNSVAGGGFINVKGEFVVPLIYGSVDRFGAQGIATVALMQHTPEIQIDKQGNIVMRHVARIITYPYDRNEYNRPQSPLIYFFTQNSHGAFMTKDGKVAIAPRPGYMEPFTDGLSAVSATDQFGQVKWGFMDEQGRLAIPYTFTNRPSAFHDGLALVTPANRTTFNYAYIDKTGKVRFTVGNGELFQPYHPGELLGMFVNGYALWYYGDSGYRLLDTLGNMHMTSEIVKQPDLEQYGEVGIDAYTEQGIFVHSFKAGTVSNTHGLVDLNGRYLFPPAFTKLTPDYYSPYAIADKNYQQNNQTVNVEGIVNRQGVFVLILKQKSVF